MSDNCSMHEDLVYGVVPLIVFVDGDVDNIL